MNFLRLHPDTERWFAQRDQCRRCQNCIVDDTEMRCWPTNELCIDARLETGSCGPNGENFHEVPVLRSVE